MKVIGLTGGTGSGKGVVASCLKELGGYIIDADKIAREVVEPGRPAYNEIVEHFGAGVLNPDKSLNRRGLGDIVFNAREKLDFLNTCTHHYINLEMYEHIEYAKARPETYSCVVLDAPLLIEAELTGICDEVWVVYTSDEHRIRRIMERDGITEEQAKSRILSQLDWEIYASHANIVIDNTGSLEDVKKQVKERFKI